MTHPVARQPLIYLLILLCWCGFTACRQEPAANHNANVAEDTSEPKPASDIVFIHEEARVQFTAPKGWKSPNADKDADDIITLTSPDEQVEVTFYVPGDESFEEAQKDIIEDLGQYIKRGKISDQETRETTINGLKAVSISGSGEDVENGKPVVWDLTIIQAQKPLFVVSIATPENFPKHAAAYETLVQSIKPLK